MLFENPPGSGAESSLCWWGDSSLCAKNLFKPYKPERYVQLSQRLGRIENCKKK